MTNKEKYKQAFSAIHVSDDFTLEATNMNRTEKKYSVKPIAAIIAACIILVGTATTAYAADIGGIQRIIQIWIRGDQTAATITFDGDGTYDMTYTDPAGNHQYMGGGGVAFNNDGSERPLTEEELMEHLMMPDVRYQDDGTVWVYWYDQVVEITNKFENDICFLTLIKDGELLYMTVKYNNGYATSPQKYVMPDEFNTGYEP